MRSFLFSCLLICAIDNLFAQEDSLPQPKRWEISGYVKNLQTLLFFNEAYPDFQQFKLVDTFLQDNLIHNRFNVKYYPNEHWTIAAECRNRIFFGDLVRSNPAYAASVDNANNDYFDLSWVWLNDNGFVGHTMLDRLYAEYSNEKWEIRLGRQRLNWGIGTVWNPNDIFNAFSFTDFDYEERPGSDAFKIKYYTGLASSIEIAAKAFDRWNEGVVAGLWRFNYRAYDFQLLAGYAEGYWVGGGGWAGNIRNAGFKGELTYFYPDEKSKDEAFAMTLGLDYAFNNSLYFNTGYLYNSLGAINADLTGLFNFQLSARNLYPYRHALFVQCAYPFTPLLNGGMAIIYSPVSSHALFVNPTLTLSVKENWDIDAVGQLIFQNKTDKYNSPIQAIFVRLKWSY